MEFNAVLNGVVKYIDREIIVGMNSWQEVIARVAMARVIYNADSIKNALGSNAIVRTFAICDESGNVDADGLVRDLKRAISEKGCIEVEVPLFGKFKFNEGDIDTLNSYIKGG